MLANVAPETHAEYEDNRFEGRDCFVMRRNHFGDVVGYVTFGEVKAKYWMCARHFVSSLIHSARTVGKEYAKQHLADPAE